MENTIETKKTRIIEIKKELYKSKVNAKFNRYEDGKLYYDIQLSDGIYQLPISTIMEIPKGDYKHYEDIELVALSADLGKTAFGPEIKASELNRWIEKSIAKDEFIKLTE